MNVMTEANIRVTLVKMQTGTGKSLIQSIMAEALLSYYKDVYVVLLHLSPETRNDSYSKYAVSNPLAINVVSDIRLTS